MMSSPLFNRYVRRWKRPVVSEPKLLAVSHEEALKLLTENPKKYHVIYITDPVDLPHDHRYKEVVGKAISTLVCLFRDVDIGETGKYAPTHDVVKKAIDWSERKENIIVCCYSGISRAPAIAYVIAAKKLVTAEWGLKVLDRNKHVPNLFIVQLGSDILKSPDMFGLILRFREEVFARMS